MHCVADSLIVKNLNFDALDLRHRFFLWWMCGYCNGRVKDPEDKYSYGIGTSTYHSILEFLKSNNPYVPSANSFNEQNNGNGSLSRMAPISIFHYFFYYYYFYYYIYIYILYFNIPLSLLEYINYTLIFFSFSRIHIYIYIYITFIS